MARKLTPNTPTIKQQRFIDCYNGDIQEAAKESGLTYGYARQLMCKPKYKYIRELIRSREVTKNNKLIATREERQEFWTRVFKGDETQPVVTGHNDDGTSVVEMVPQAMKDRLKASELLGKSEADFVERKRLEDAGGKPLKWQIEVVKPKDSK